VDGGAVSDLGQALAPRAPAGTDPLTHLDVNGAGEPIGPGPLPFAAFPITVGTGAEATRTRCRPCPRKRPR